MSEQRTAAEVRQHIEQLRQVEMNAFANELEDVLEAAVKLREAYLRCYEIGGLCRDDELVAGTLWLEATADD